MPRSPAKSFTSTVANPPDTEIPCPGSRKHGPTPSGLHPHVRFTKDGGDGHPHSPSPPFPRYQMLLCSGNEFDRTAEPNDSQYPHCGTHSRNISRAIRESSRKSMRGGGVRRFGRESSGDAAKIRRKTVIHPGCFFRNPIAAAV